MSTIQISGLPTVTTVQDTALFATENGGITQNFSAATLKTYMSNMSSLTVSGAIAGSTLTGTLLTANQPNITNVGTLTGLTLSGQLISTVATGTAPIVVASSTKVSNLYVDRAALADATTNGLTTTTTFANSASSDATITGTNSTLIATLKNVNSTAGTFGGNVGSTYYIPQFVVNNKGLITSASNVAVNLNLSGQAVTNLQGTTNQITVSASVGTSVVSLPSQINITNLSAGGTLAGAIVTDNSNRVLTGVTVTAGTGLSGGGTISGPTGSVTLNNTGVTSIVAGSGISISASTGAVTISSSVTGVTGSSGITVTPSGGGVIISPTSGYNGYGVRTISSGTPSGGADGDIWYQV